MGAVAFFAACVAASLVPDRPLAFTNETSEGLTELIGSAGRDVSLSRARFLGYPAGCKDATLRPNPAFWLKGADFTCASPWNDESGCFRAGTAISRRHVIFAKHYPLGVGTRIAFVGETGAMSHYRIVATRGMAERDIMVGLLDYELTPDVHPAKVLPPDFAKWIAHGTVWPVVTFNRSENALLSAMTVQWNAYHKKMEFINCAPQSAGWQRFAGELTSGDSGNPAFLLCCGRPILLYCIRCGGVGYGPFIHEYRCEVQRLMDELCPGYKLEDFDFSSADGADGRKEGCRTCGG